MPQDRTQNTEPRRGTKSTKTESFCAFCAFLRPFPSRRVVVHPTDCSVSEIQNLSLVIPLLPDERELCFQRRPVFHATIHNLLQFRCDDEKAVHFDSVFD